MQYHKRSKYKRKVKILNADIKAAPNTAPEIVNAEIIKAAKDKNGVRKNDWTLRQYVNVM